MEILAWKYLYGNSRTGIWLLGTMPWGPLVGYGLWKAPKNNVYRYALTWSLVTILFYSVMATKYMTYTYISLIGFSVIAAMGLEEIWSGNVALRRSIRLNW